MLSLVRGARPAASPDSLAEGYVSLSTAGQAWMQNRTVLTVILLSAVFLYQRFWHDAPSLWYSPAHDRNGHYRRSQHVAHALRHGSLAGLVKQIHFATVWPPLHPLVTGSVLAVGGIDYRLAVLPSLLAWAATSWFAFALARRLVPRYQGLAGGVALLLTLTSPAHRAFAIDIMLESSGAALTLAALYFYVTARQEDSARSGRCFALLLLALFLTKYNYWTLLAVGLILSTLCEFHLSLLVALEAWRPAAAWRHVLGAQLRQPLTYLLLLSLGLAFYVIGVGPLTFALAGQHLELETLEFPALLCFIFLLARVLPWWRRSGRHVVNRLPVPARQLVHWHIYPLTIWFLWPRRLGVFLWYVTYTQHGRSGDSSPWAGSFTYYWQCLRNDYHANLTSLIVVLALIFLAVCARRRMTGSTAVFVFLAVAALLTNYHSSNRSRFLHSWIAVSWVVAGVGAARVLDQLTRHGLPSGFPTAVLARAGSGTGKPPWQFLGQALVFAALAGLTALQGSAFIKPGHSEEGGTQGVFPSLLMVADAVVPELIKARQPVVVADEPFAWLLDWRLCEYGEPSRPLLTLPRELLSPISREQLDGWLDRTSCDALLLIDAPPRPGSECYPRLDIRNSRACLVSSTQFKPGCEWHCPTAGNITAQIWRSTHSLVSSQRKASEADCGTQTAFGRVNSVNSAVALSAPEY
jgi:hypothetical protein